MEPLPVLVNTGAAARQLGVSVGTIRRWAKLGQIPYVLMPSGRMRFNPDDLAGVYRQVDTNPAIPA